MFNMSQEHAPKVKYEYTNNLPSLKDILLERDGPMLKYGLQEVNDIKLILPKQRKLYPDRERLAFRFEEFKHIA